MTWLILTIYGNRHPIQRVTCWVKTYRDYSREINNVFEWTKGRGTDDKSKKNRNRKGNGSVPTFSCLGMEEIEENSSF
jgi:hypothetical protein